MLNQTSIRKWSYLSLSLSFIHVQVNHLLLKCFSHLGSCLEYLPDTCNVCPFTEESEQ